MKKYFYPVLGLLALSMAACTNDEEPTTANNLEIKMSADMHEYAVVSRAALEDFGGETYNFVRWDGDTPAYDAAALNATITALGAITFTNTQYYPVNGDKVNFVGYYPAGTNTNGTISFTETMDGQQDIMYAAAVSGNKTTPIADKAVEFNHLLSQLKFVFVKDASFTDDAVQVTDLKVTGTCLPTTLALANGTLNFAADATDLTVFTGKTYGVGDTPTETVLVQPGASIKLSVKLSGITDAFEVTPTITDGTLAAGTSYTITLTFKQKSVEATGKMGTWNTGTGSGDVE